MNIVSNFKFFLKIIELKFFDSSAPLSVIFNVTNRCNCSCKHCYATYYLRDNSRELTTLQVKHIIKELVVNGCQRVSFSGGEPLLRKDMGDLIAYAKGLGMSVTLNSNGILVPHYINDLKNLDALAISLDGKPENHDLIRGEGTAEKAINGIISATAAGIKVHTNTVLHKYNINDIDYIIDLAKKLKLKAEFNLAINNIFGDSDINPDIKASQKEIRKALEYIIRLKKNKEPILFSASAYESVLNCWQDFEVEGCLGTEAPDGMPQCPAGKLFCLIDYDGTLWACPHLIGKIDACNILDVGIKEAWKVAKRHTCKGCYQVYHHEFSHLMNLKPQVTLNYIKAIIGIK